MINANQKCILRPLLRFACLFAWLVTFAVSAYAQLGTPTFSTAYSAATSFPGGSVDVANGALHLEIPLGTFPQRGGSGVSIKLVYNSRIWSVYDRIPTQGGPIWTTNGSSLETGGFIGDLGGWSLVAGPPMVLPTMVYGGNGNLCDSGTGYGPWVATDPDGTQHTFPLFLCSYPAGNYDAYALDASGEHLFVNFNNDSYSAILYAKDGRTLWEGPGCSGGNQVDTNYNFVSWSVPISETDECEFQDTPLDTLGRAPIALYNNGQLSDYQDFGYGYLYFNAVNRGTNQFKVLNSTGSTGTVNIALGTGTTSTYFQVSGVHENVQGFSNLSSVSLPDLSGYTFTYDCNSGSDCTNPGTNNAYGELMSVTLPTGGTVNFSYQNFTDANGNTNRWINSVVYNGQTWSYAPLLNCGAGCQTVTQTRPSGDTSVYTFTLNQGVGTWISSVQHYTGSSTLAMSIQNSYQAYTTDPSLGGFAFTLPQTTAVTVPGPSGNLVQQTSFSYDSFTYNYLGNNYIGSTGKITTKSEYAYGNGAIGPLARKTTYAYWDDANPAYKSVNIMDRVSDLKVFDGSNNMAQETKTSYDSTAFTAVTGVEQHLNSGSSLRGNPTQVQQWVSGANYISTSINFDDTGQITQIKDSNGNQTSFSYNDNFYDDSSGTVPQQYTAPVLTHAYLTNITLPVIGSSTYGYYYGTGQRALVTDQNSRTTYLHFLDPFNRPTMTNFPDGAWTLRDFVSTTETDQYTGITSTSPSTSCTGCRHDQSFTDAFGRIVKQVLASDPDGSTAAVIGYDVNGRPGGFPQTISNPYRGSGPIQGESTAFDGLDRPRTRTRADGSIVNSYYGASVAPNGGISTQLCSGSLGYPVLAVDEANKKRQTWLDAFGRTIEVDEPDANNNLTNATCYSYDPNDNLTQVSQGGETRIFVYDGLSRLTSSTSPETSTTTYQYDINSNLVSRTQAEPNQTNPAVTVTTTYSYDALNRLTQKSYSDSTPTVNYSYDSTNCLGLPACFNIGRRTSMTDASGSTSWAYDAMGNVLKQLQTINNIAESFLYTYNLDNSVATLTYPSGHTLTYTEGGADRATNLADNTNSSNPIPYATSVHYTAFGGLSSLLSGSSNILSTWLYNSRLQPCRMAVNSVGSAPATCTDSNNGNILDLNYGYGTQLDNGNVNSISDNRPGMAGRSLNFYYDNLNRITQASTVATSGAYCWSETYMIDRFGNMSGIGSTSDHPTCSQESLNLLPTAQNRLSTGSGSDYQYDAAGNLIATPAPQSASFGYDAEDHLTQVNDFFAAGYLYDGDGKRVAKISSGIPYQLYWYGIDSAPLAVSDGSGNFTDEYIFFNGKRIARRVVQ